MDQLAEDGATPLTFNEIQNSLGNTSDRWVLFDSSVGGVLGSNHWRIIGKDDDRREVTLSFCGSFGNYDMKGIEPFTMSIETPFFSGVTVHEYTRKDTGITVSLQQVVDFFNKNNNKTEYPYKNRETIYWVDGVSMDPEQKERSKFIPHNH